MTARQVRGILIGAGVAMVLAEVFVVLVGFWGSPWWLLLASSVFVTPAIGIMGAMLAAVAVASEEEAPEGAAQAPAERADRAA
jgi:ABC-type transport system involved in cytochrome c biogenesis permease component